MREIPQRYAWSCACYCAATVTTTARLFSGRVYRLVRSVQAGGVRDSEHPKLLAALVSWQREHSVLSQSCANPRASGSSGSLASCSISRSNSITSLGTAPSVSARTATVTATISGSPHSSRADFGARGHTDGGKYSHQTMSGNIFGAGRGGFVPETPNTVAPTAASLGFISTDPLCAACCNAMLSAYCSAPVPEADRAACLLRLLHSCAPLLHRRNHKPG